MTHSSAVQPTPVEDDRASYILVARYKKARAIAKSLLALGADRDATIELGKTEIGRTLAAHAAGARVPSPTSWALVVELVGETRP